MSTIRTVKTKEYSVIDNTVLNDVNLSWRAKGIAVYLLSKPDNWTVNHKDIWKNGKEGRDAVLKALTELEEAGYLVRTRGRNELGQWENESILYERPQQPSPENQNPVPSPENPDSDNQNSIINTDVVNTETTSFADAKGSAPVSGNEEQPHSTVMEKEDTSTTKSTKGRKRKQDENSSLSEADEPKPMSEHQQYLHLLAEIVGWDTNIIADRHWKQLAQTKGILEKKGGYSLEDVRDWYFNVWLDSWEWKNFENRLSLTRLREKLGEYKKPAPQAPPPKSMTLPFTMESLYGDD